MNETGHAHEKAHASEKQDREAQARNRPASDLPAAGPHAAPDLTAPEKTPGAGSLPDPDNPQEGDATTG